jgi:glycosyltransferase involved in cell wall biosynthesis
MTSTPTAKPLHSAFSVLMAVYASDSVPLFRDALTSVYANSVTPDELILVLDGPVTPALHQVIEGFRERPGFVVVPLERNVGLAHALNAGLQRVTHALVFRADADDINLPDRFEKQLARFDESVDVLGGAILEVTPQGFPVAVRRLPLEADEIRRFARKRNPFNHMTVAFRREVAQACGGYPAVHLKEDYALWALMLSRGARVANLHDVLVHATAGRAMYRRRGGLRYVQSEIALQRHLVHCGLQNRSGALLNGLLRSAVFLMPASWRGFVYERLLRRPSEDAR